jgi:DNA-binding transcriptional regulator/RsmH inhibitor MraZ
MINPPLSVDQKSRVAVPAVCRGAKGREKFLAAKIQRNSLKKLDSDE